MPRSRWRRVFRKISHKVGPYRFVINGVRVVNPINLWPYNWVTGVITPRIGVIGAITLLITGRGPTLQGFEFYDFPVNYITYPNKFGKRNIIFKSIGGDMLVPRVIHNLPIIRSDGIGATDGLKKANQLWHQEYHRDHQMKKFLGIKQCNCMVNLR